MEALVRFVIRFRWVLLPLILAAVLFFGYHAREQKINNAVDIWFVEDDPNLKAYKSFQERFGNDEFVAIALHDERTIFTPANLRLIVELTARLEAADHVSEVISLASALYISVEGDELRVEKTMEDLPQTPEEAEGSPSHHPIHHVGDQHSHCLSSGASMPTRSSWITLIYRPPYRWVLNPILLLLI